MNEPRMTGWTACERGELTQFVSRLAFRRRLATLALTGSVLAAASGFGAYAWYLATASHVRPASDEGLKTINSSSLSKGKRS